MKVSTLKVILRIRENASDLLLMNLQQLIFLQPPFCCNIPITFYATLLENNFFAICFSVKAKSRVPFKIKNAIKPQKNYA